MEKINSDFEVGTLADRSILIINSNPSSSWCKTLPNVDQTEKENDSFF